MAADGGSVGVKRTGVAPDTSTVTASCEDCQWEVSIRVELDHLGSVTEAQAATEELFWQHRQARHP